MLVQSDLAFPARFNRNITNLSLFFVHNLKLVTRLNQPYTTDRYLIVSWVVYSNSDIACGETMLKSLCYGIAWQYVIVPLCLDGGNLDDRRLIFHVGAVPTQNGNMCRKRCLRRLFLQCISRTSSRSQLVANYKGICAHFLATPNGWFSCEAHLQFVGNVI